METERANAKMSTFLFNLSLAKAKEERLPTARENMVVAKATTKLFAIILKKGCFLKIAI